MVCFYAFPYFRGGYAIPACLVDAPTKRWLARCGYWHVIGMG